MRYRLITLPKDIAHFAQSPIYYKAPESTLSYVGYVSPAIIAGPSDEYAYEYDESGEQKPEIGAEPSLQFTRDTWWDALLVLYNGRSHGHLPDATALTPAMKDNTKQQVLGDLRQLFRASNYWFSFLNVNRFFGRLLDVQQRHMVQPSLVLGALAVSVFIHSSEREGGAKGRAFAMRLRDEAQGALEASLNTRSIDVSLVHAAWVCIICLGYPSWYLLTFLSQLIAFFEICAHQNHSAGRVHSTFRMLDSLIRLLALTQVDKSDSRVSAFASQIVPNVPSSPQQSHQWNPSTHALHGETPTGPCTCASYTLGHNNPRAQSVTPL